MESIEVPTVVNEEKVENEDIKTKILNTEQETDYKSEGRKKSFKACQEGLKAYQAERKKLREEKKQQEKEQKKKERELERELIRERLSHAQSHIEDSSTQDKNAPSKIEGLDPIQLPQIESKTTQPDIPTPQIENALVKDEINELPKISKTPIASRKYPEDLEDEPFDTDEYMEYLEYKNYQKKQKLMKEAKVKYEQQKRESVIVPTYQTNSNKKPKLDLMYLPPSMNRR